ncbi:uncharacterized protein J3D65DRAFT_671279 [Phyllosticta citribraziliensis]|uniref:Uncharacterized protein n=1 Tax=Phyllosticta citribraziliensis TaxID=989973 RepID=A0ABR1L8C2_9PEZI
MFLASFVASASQLCRRSANFVLMLQEFAKHSLEEPEETMSHLYFVLQQTHPSRRPDFAKYPTLFSKAVFICDPHVWPNLAKKTVHTLLTPSEIWRFMCFGPLVAPIPYLLFLCALFGIFNDPKAKSVKPRTWIITACVWISLIVTLALAEHTKGGKHAVEALSAVLAPLVGYLPSLQPLDQLVERASQAVGLPFRFLPSSLFLAKLAHHIYLICSDVFHGWLDWQIQAARNEQRTRPTQQPTREAAYRADSEGESEEGLPQEDNIRRQNYLDKMRRHFAVIEEQLAVKAMHEDNIQRILDEWREGDRQQQIDAADTQSEITSLASDLEGMEEDGDNNIDAEGDGEQEYNSPERQQPPVDQIQSPTSPANDQIVAHQPLQELGIESPIQTEDGERTHSSFERQRGSVDFSISPTSPVEGPNLADELAGYDSDYEEEVEDEDDGQGGDVDDQSSPQITHQTAEPSHGGDGFEAEEEQNSPHSTHSDKSSRSADGPEGEAEQSSPLPIDQTADYSHSEYSEYSNEGEEEQSSPQTSDAAEPSLRRDDREHENQSSPPSAPSIDLADLDDAQYFIDESDCRAAEEEVPRFLAPVPWKPEGQRKGKEPAQTGRGRELTRMAGEQFGDEHVTVAELQCFRQEGQKEEDENRLPSDHLKKLAEAQDFTSKADKQHNLRTLENFVQEGEAAEQARQQARSDGNEELRSFQQGQAFVDGEDEQLNARALRKFVKDGKKKQQQETSQPDLKALSNAQFLVEGDEVDQTAQEVDNFIEEGKAEQQAQQASQPNFRVMSNAQSFVKEAEIAQTAQEVNDFVKAGKTEQQQNEKTKADRKEELKAFQKRQAFINKKDEQHNQRSLDKFMREGEAEEQARQASQPDLKNLKEAQYFGDEHESGDDDEEHDKPAKDSGNASSSTHDGGDDDGDGLQTILEEHEDDEDGADANAEADADNSDTEPEYTLSNTRDYYDERLDREQPEQRVE